MARVKVSKQAVSPIKKQEAKQRLDEMTRKFSEDIKELQKSKREHAVSFEEYIYKFVCEKYQQEVLDMKLNDYFAFLKMQVKKEEPSTPQRTVAKSDHFMLKTPTGSVRVPRQITLHAEKQFRTLKKGEITFSKQGTPILAASRENSFQSFNAYDHNLETSDQVGKSPKTKELINKLRNVIDAQRKK